MNFSRLITSPFSALHINNPIHMSPFVPFSCLPVFNALKIKDFWRVFCFTLLCISLVLWNLSCSDPAFAATKKKSGPNNKYASIVIDAQTGMVLSQDNADRSLHPASLTKMMTMALVFDALNARKISQKTRLTVSSRGASMPPSKIGLSPRQTIPIYDALRVLATKSANDVAVTVAENLGGSEARFAQLMNLKAREIGMTNTHFVNASGLHDYRQVSSARDMAKLAKYMIDTYPQYYSIFGLKHYKYDGKVFHSHNKLMNTYQGMDGIKTGYVAASGFNLVASAKHGNTRLIGVVFGGRTAASRNSHMANLLDKGFERIKDIKRSGYANQQPVLQIAQGKTDSFAAVPIPPAKPAEYRSKVVSDTQIAATTQVPVLGMNTLTITPTITPQATPVLQNNLVINEPRPQPMDHSTNWQIQIGAFEDRASTNKALYDTMVLLPEYLNKGKTLVVPLRTQDAKWVFRARLSGYTRQEALDACSNLKTRLKDCLPIAPQSR